MKKRVEFETSNLRVDSKVDFKRSTDQGFSKILAKMRTIITPPEPLTVSQWAEKYRRLSAESSSSAGKLKLSNAEYQREMLDVFSDPKTKKVIYMTSSQVGKSTCVETVHGYYMHQKPCPMLNVNANGQMAEEFSKSRISPMIRDTPVLAELFSKASRAKSTIARILFPSGSMSFAIASSPASLASRPVKVLTMDEVDRYEITKEGDAVQIAIKRTMTFWDSKILLASTPANEGSSVIEAQYLLSDQRKYHIACKDCDHEQIFKWKNVKWESGDDGVLLPESVHYQCEACSYKMSDLDRYRAIKRGRWIASKPFAGVAGFHLSELYSPWRTLQQVVESFLECKNSADLLQVWTNTCLGETWKETGESVDPSSLMIRATEYKIREFVLPSSKIVSITIGVDVQKDYLQYEVVGWGNNDESWSLEVGELMGNTEQKDTLEMLNDVVNQRWTHPTEKRKVSVKMMFVDSGYRATTVYDYVLGERSSNIKAIKGRAGKIPVIDRMGTDIKKRTATNKKLVIVGVDTGKATVYAYLNVEVGNSGYCHFGEHCGTEFFAQLTAEELRIKFRKGFTYKEWFKVRERNEALDCRNYAYAAHKFKKTYYNAEYLRLTAPDPKTQPHKPKKPASRVRMKS